MPPPPPSVLLHDPHRQHVRCVLRGAPADSDALTDVSTFVRGIAALYGDRFDVEVDTTTSSSSNSLNDTPRAAQNGDDSDVSEDSLTATVTITTEANSAGGSRATNLILRGRAAITQRMKELLETRLAAPAEQPIRIFVSGDRSQVGKSTVCLGLVGALLLHGFAPEDIGYIKPATQCEKPQLVAKFCQKNGITFCDIGPIVFYSGFTREFLKGNTDPPDVLLASAKAKVDEIGMGKKVVVVDGVGYPAVGSICGVSNAAVASAVQAPVVLVGKRGVGDAVDSFNLNAAFFESQGVKVLGALFNRLPQDGYYSLENCKESVTAYFEQFQPHKHVYGFIPEMVQDSEEDSDVNGNNAPCEPEPAEGDLMTKQEAKQAKKVIDTFYEHVNLTQLLEDARQSQSFEVNSVDPEAKHTLSKFAVKRARRTSTSPIANNEAAANENGEDGEPVVVKRSRAEIQAAAKASGAAGG